MTTVGDGSERLSPHPLTHNPQTIIHMEHTRSHTQTYLNMMPYKLMVKARALVLDDENTFASFEEFIKHLTGKDEANKKLWLTVLSMYELGILRDCTETEERLVAKYNESIVNIFENVATN